jgi:uncharacterized protein (TIGR00661 family)
MKILYAVQATGNGHISRATILIPYLQKYGKVDVFLSGSNSQLGNELQVKYQGAGLGLFYNNNGGLHYSKIAKQLNPLRLAKAVRTLPVEKYDIVINDYEAITAMACAFKGVASVQFGHQASFQSPLAPRPAKKEILGEWLLKNFSVAKQYVGLHFKKYDDFIFTPVIKKEILNARPVNKGHITVYLSSYRDENLLQYFRLLKNFRFHVFSKQVQQTTQTENVTFIPVNQKAFNESMVTAHAVITGAGFETPAEVMHLQKKLMVVPIKGQYEQLCNAAALHEFGITIIPAVDEYFVHDFYSWMQSNEQQPVHYTNNYEEVISYVLENHPYKGMSLDLLYPNMIFN